MIRKLIDSTLRLLSRDNSHGAPADQLSPATLAEKISAAKSAIAAKNCSDASRLCKDLLSHFVDAPDLRQSIAETLYDLATAFAKQGDYKNARLWYTTVVERNAHLVPALRAAAATSIALNQPKLAIPHLRHLLELQPSDENAQALLARAYAMDGDFKTADQLINALTSRNPHSAGLVELRAEVFTALKDYSSARTLLSNALDSMELSLTERLALAQALARVESQCGNVKDAIVLLERYRRTATESPEANITLARLYLVDKRFSQAATLGLEVLENHPRSVATHLITGEAFLRGESVSQAIDVLRRAQTIVPSNEMVISLLTEAFVTVNQLDSAERAFEQFLDNYPESSQIHQTYARFLSRFGERDDSRHENTLALHYDAQNSDALLLAGDFELEDAHFEKARELFQRHLDATPQSATGYERLANCLIKLDSPEDAIRTCATGCEIAGESPALLNIWGLALRNLGNFESALNKMDQALRLDPSFGDALHNQALLNTDLGRLPIALQQYETLGRMHPDDDDLKWRHALALLLARQYTPGWRLYSYRWVSSQITKRNFQYPLWNSQPLVGKRLLIYGEQGMGDEILFASCLPDLMQHYSSITLECAPQNADLFRRSFPAMTIVPRKTMDQTSHITELGPFDFQIAIGDLPRVLRPGIDHFPNHKGYLLADPAKVQRWKERLSGGQKLFVGISWKGGTAQTRGRIRSIPLLQLAQAAHRPGVHLINLQYGNITEDLSELARIANIEVSHFPEMIRSYDETAACIMSLDLVISVQTSVVHLAGGLGKPVWVLLPTSPEWAFHAEGEKSDWYPSARLFRQAEPGNWQPVLEQIRQDIDGLLAERFRT